MSIATSNLTSGFIDLATYDEQEKYTYGGSESIAYFVREVRKSTWFTQVPVVLSRSSGSAGFGQQWSVSISRAGDYLLHTWLRVVLPSVQAATVNSTKSLCYSQSSCTRTLWARKASSRHRDFRQPGITAQPRLAPSGGFSKHIWVYSSARSQQRAPAGQRPTTAATAHPGDASTAARSCLCCRTFVSASNASAARPWRRAAREIRRLWTSQDRRSQCPSAAAAAAAQHHPLPRGGSTPRAVGPLPAILSPIPFFSLDLPSLPFPISLPARADWLRPSAPPCQQHHAAGGTVAHLHNAQ